MHSVQVAVCALAETSSRWRFSPPPTPDPAACNPALATLPPELATWLATLLARDRHYLRNKHLIPMVRDGQLRFRYPESAKHPHQAYVAPGAEDKHHG